jgi:biotin carboxylase
MQNKIVFIAGGAWQKPFVKYLKSKGDFVAVVNPVETDTTALADLHIKLDVNDLEEINKYMDEIHPTFITSDQSDISTMTVARLSEKRNLPGNSVETIHKFTNKFAMYEFAKHIGVPFPETEIAGTPEDVARFAVRHGFPIILKPTDATNSRGFRKINSTSDITEELLLASRKFSKSKQVIVQNFIDGEMITLEGVCSGNKHRTIASSKKDGYFKAGITSGVRYPAQIPSSLLKEIIAVNDRYAELAGMEFGLTHAEYIIKDNDFHLIEIGGRGGGAGITDKIVPWVSGITTYDVLYNSLKGEKIDVANLSPLNRAAILKYYTAEEMAQCSEEKARKISELPGVADFQFNFIGKQYVRDDNDSRHSMAIYLADSDAGINEIMKKVRNFF